jgi:hypothetical protein
MLKSLAADKFIEVEGRKLAIHTAQKAHASVNHFLEPSPATAT